VETNKTIQIVDPEITRQKFDAELKTFRAVQERYQRKGVICHRVLYPDIFFLFAIPKFIPYPIAFAIKVNFTNYDFEPPSVVFINPFTNDLLKREQIPIAFIQVNHLLQPQDLLQGVGDILPFFCIPGVREYHDHAAHSGDSWFLHRTKGEGSLLFILDQLYNHSIPISKGYLASFITPTIRINQEILVQQKLNIK
jgi:hypothetical protein